MIEFQRRHAFVAALVGEGVSVETLERAVEKDTSFADALVAEGVQLATIERAADRAIAYMDDPKSLGRPILLELAPDADFEDTHEAMLVRLYAIDRKIGTS